MRYLSLILILYFISASEEGYKELNADEIYEILKKNKKTIILDTRDEESISKGYIQNSIIIPLSMDYSMFLTTVIRGTASVIIISDENNYSKAINKVQGERINISGYAFFDHIKDQISYTILKVDYKEATKKNLEKLAQSNKVIIDLREIEEYKETGIIENSKLIPLSELHNKIKRISKVGDMYLICKTGERALMAMSFFKKSEFANKIYILKGGIDKAIKEGYNLVEYSDN